ncbi:12039_t:CDS:1, partial [Racocetra fulgida]
EKKVKSNRVPEETVFEKGLVALFKKDQMPKAPDILESGLIDITKPGLIDIMKPGLIDITELGLIDITDPGLIDITEPEIQIIGKIK